MGRLLVENNKSNFIAVIPVNASRDEKHAAKELCNAFYRATGIELPCVFEDDKKAHEFKNTIQIGQTQKLAQAKIDLTNGGAGESGYVIKTADNTVYICGFGGSGTVFGVYEFLHQQFGYEAYALEEIDYGTIKENEHLKDINRRDIPDFPYRQGFGKYFNSTRGAQLLRFNTYDEAFVRDSHQPWHNTFRMLPPKVYNNPEKPETYHPKWYVKPDIQEGENQISVTANGDEEELNALRDTIFQKMTEYIEQSFANGKYCQLIGFMQEDNGLWTEGESMQPFVDKYGKAAPAASLIYFLNPIAKRLRQYMKEKYNGRPMYIVTFAYWQTIEAPVKLVDGKYEPIDDSVKLEDGLSIFYAPTDAEFTLPFTHEKNKFFKETLDKWHSLSENISLWIYSMYCRRFFIFYDNFDAMQFNLRFFKKYKPYYLFNESQVNFGNFSFYALKEYVTAKLMWNTEEDLELLYKNFFKNYYKAVADDMFQMFKDTKAYQYKIVEEKNFPRRIFDFIFEKEYWPLEILDEFIAKTQAMIEKIKPISLTNPYKYNLLKERILSEGIGYRYLKQHFYPESYGDEMQLREAREEFRQDCAILRLTAAACGEPLSWTFNDWQYTYAL